MAAVLRKLIQGRLPALAGVLCRRSGNEGHLFLNSSGSTLMQPRCGYSSPTESVIVEMDKATGVALLKLNIPPVNSLSLPLLTELAIVLDKLEMDKHCRGLILTSAVPNIFSAGLNLFDMMDKPNEHYSEFWRAVQEIWIKLYGSSLANIAAINGSSPAGGCLLALCSDYRIMANNPHFTIGLNETRLGIVAPFWFKDTLLNTVGKRTTEISLNLGALYSPTEALSLHLVDRLVPETQLLSAATEEMGRWLQVPDHARQITKSMIRKSTLEGLLNQREADIKNFVEFISRDSIQKSLQFYAQSLQKQKQHIHPPSSSCRQQISSVTFARSPWYSLIQRS
uniref:Enoyl-CoA delta isomerase 1, mitochondrial n=1 Tax=Eptatretus burgeri TaxID=7764 RepID=A0A8C4NN67_EPTBU